MENKSTNKENKKRDDVGVNINIKRKKIKNKEMAMIKVVNIFQKRGTRRKK